MMGYPNIVDDYRRHIKRQERHSRTDPDIQAERQARAVRDHEAREAERVLRLPVIAKESEPNSDNPLVARPRLKPLPIQKPKKPRIGRVAAARALNKQATHKEQL